MEDDAGEKPARKKPEGGYSSRALAARALARANKQEMKMKAVRWCRETPARREKLP